PSTATLFPYTTLFRSEHMVRAAEVFGIIPITRIPNHEDSTILRFLDRGVQGIIVPHVNTREAAEAVAGAARYWPDGHRGMAGGRDRKSTRLNSSHGSI